jgi:hypothetical protein
MAFIVNHGGVVHSVPDEQVAVHLGVSSIAPNADDPAGKPARMASRAEIAEWHRKQGLEVPAEFAEKGEDADEAPAAPKAPRAR